VIFKLAGTPGSLLEESSGQVPGFLSAAHEHHPGKKIEFYGGDDKGIRDRGKGITVGVFHKWILKGPG